ncbi:pilus assembly protein [Yersinia ruckeri]
MQKKEILLLNRLEKNKPLLNTILMFLENKKGGIIIPFFISLPFFIAIIMLLFDFTQLINNKIKLSDALEQGALALTAENNAKNDTRNNELISAYINFYLGHRHQLTQYNNITVNYQQNPDRLYHTQLSQYHIDANIEQPTLFPFTSLLIDHDNFIIGGSAAAIKDIPAMDVVFVTDFSGSMEGDFHNPNDPEVLSKLDELKRLFFKIADDIYTANKDSTISFSPFSWGTKSADNKKCSLHFMPKEKNKIYPIPSNEIERNTEAHQEKYMIAITENIDYLATIENIGTNNEKIVIPLDHVHDELCLYSSNAYPISLAKDIDDLNVIKTMNEGGSTLVSSGIMQGADLLMDGVNHNKLMIILSDGHDYPTTAVVHDKTITSAKEVRVNVDISRQLVQHGMCKKIRETVGRIVFIGIGYNPSANHYINWAEDCVDTENFYLAMNTKELEDSIRSALVSDKVGTNTPVN